MAFITPSYMQPNTGDADITYSGATVRSNQAGMFVAEGVLGPSTSLAVSQRGAGANMSVDVAAGWCVVQGDDATGQGMYLCHNDATVNVTTDLAGTALSAPASGTRTHRVVVLIRDEQANGAYANQYNATPFFVFDTGSGLPALPASAVEIARVSVSSGQASVTNAHITDRRMWMGMSGGVADVLTSGDGPASPYTNQLRVRRDTGLLERWTGSVWRPVATEPFVKVAKLTTVSSSINAGVSTPIAWEQVLEESDSTMWDIGQAARLVIPRAGLYHVTWTLPAGVNSGGYATTWVQKNGSSAVRWRGTVIEAATVSHDWYMIGSQYIRCAASDYLEVWMSSHLATTFLKADLQDPSCTVVWVRP